MLLQLLIRCNLFLFQILGIFPCYYDVTKRRWKSSRLLRIYSMLVFILQIIALLIGVYVVSNDVMKSNPSKTMYYASQITCALIIVNIVVVYVFQLKNISSFIEFANELQFIYEKIELYCHQSGHWSILVILVKLTFNVILNCIVTIIEIKNLSAASSVMHNEILFQIFYFCPNFVLMMLPSMFYCLVMFLEHTLKQFNSVLLKIVANSSLLNNNDDSEPRKFYTMLQSCDLSDRIENISIIFSSLYKSTRKLNKVFNVQLMASNCCTVSALVLKLYLVFVMIATINSSNYLLVIMASFRGLFNQFLYLYGTYLVAASCSNISKEVTLMFINKN